MGALDEYLTALDALPPEKREAVIEEALDGTKDMVWVPTPGPQTDAYFCEADELLFGGEPGGGKSDLIIGLSLTAHERSLVLRRTNKEAEKLFERYEAIIGNDDGKNAQKGWRIAHRTIDIGGCQLEADKQKRKGHAQDFYGFDELVDFTKTQYEFITTWNRSTKKGQRCRIVSTTNPPTSPEGLWVVERWAAWFDPKHPRPAESGEIRWYVKLDGKELEVDGRGPYPNSKGKMIPAKSRCFIRSKLEDNPDLTQNDHYATTLANLPQELQAMGSGDFESGLKDQAFQMIPTEWVRLAQQRWNERSPDGVPMCAMGVDCSGGGDDPLVIAPRYDGWYPHPIEVPGKDLPQDRIGKLSAGHIVSHRRNKALVIVDMGGGFGGSTYEQLKENDIMAIAYKGSEKSTRRTNDGQLGFTNIRTQAYWKFREALDPGQPGGSPISLYPSKTVLADLCTPTFELRGGQIQMEPKEDVVARLGRSTNEGDAVVMAWHAGPTYVTDGQIWSNPNEMGGAGNRAFPSAIMGRQSRRR